jgi:cytochrome c553
MRLGSRLSGALVRGCLAGTTALISLVCLSSGCKHDAGPVVEVDSSALYAQMCARCHGDDGRGNAAMAQAMPIRDLTGAEVRSQPTEALERVIMAGRNQMPAFGDMLTPRKIQAVIGHIKRLGDK